MPVEESGMLNVFSDRLHYFVFSMASSRFLVLNFHIVFKVAVGWYGGGGATVNSINRLFTRRWKLTNIFVCVSPSPRAWTWRHDSSVATASRGGEQKVLSLLQAQNFKMS